MNVEFLDLCSEDLSSSSDSYASDVSLGKIFEDLTDILSKLTHYQTKVYLQNKMHILSLNDVKK